MTTPLTPASQPIFGGRDIGVTYFAISGLRDLLLADVGMTFPDSLLLAALAGRDGSATRGELADVLMSGLKISADAASAHVDELIAHDLASETAGTVTATPLGAESHDRFTERVAQNIPKLYGGISDEDLAITRRVLETVTERANRELELTSRR
jgi:DNA-binding MarR family transcriptional regulator